LDRLKFDHLQCHADTKTFIEAPSLVCFPKKIKKKNHQNENELFCFENKFMNLAMLKLFEFRKSKKTLKIIDVDRVSKTQDWKDA